MQIQRVTSSQYENFNNKNSINPNFTSIKSVKCEGLYKKYPEFANGLVQAFKNNPIAMDFCKKYNVDIVFYAIKQANDSVQSSVNIFFENLAKSKLRKFFENVLGKSDDKVVIYAWGNKYSCPKSLEESTKSLITAILPEQKLGSKYSGGLLDSHIKLADEKIQSELAEKSKKVSAKRLQKNAESVAKNKLDSDTSALQKSIDDLINS